MTVDPYYSDDRATLWAGDALSVLPSIPDGSITATVVDPPYSMVPNAVRGRDDGAAGTSGSPVMLVNETLRHCRRVLRDGGIAAIICDWRRVPDGMRLATCVAWTRTTIGTGGLFRSSWDPVLIASNGTPDAIDRAAIPNVVTVNPPTVRQHPYEKPPELWAPTATGASSMTMRPPTTSTIRSWSAPRSKSPAATDRPTSLSVPASSSPM